MGQSYAPRGTTIAPGTEVTIGQEAAASQRPSSARGNQAMQERLPAVAPDCALGDEACGLDVNLDEVLGEGALADIGSVMEDITARSASIIRRLDASGDEKFRLTYLPHVSGAMNLNGLLNDKSVALEASAQIDNAGELTWSSTLESQVVLAWERAEAAIEVLGGIDDLLATAELKPFLLALAAWWKLNKGVLEELRIRAESGRAMMDMLVVDFAARKALFEEHVAAATKDAVSLAVGPFDKLVKAQERVKRLWALTNAMNAVQTTPSDPWAMLKALKGIGFTVMGEMLAPLAKDNPMREAWGHLSLVVNTCQFMVDAGPAAKDLALLQELLKHAESVRDHYGATMRFYEGNQKEIDAQILVFGRLAELGAAVDERMSAAQAAIEGSGASSLDFYYPFS